MYDSSQLNPRSRLHLSCHHHRPSNRRHYLRVHRLHRRTSKGAKDEKETVGAKLEMEMKNMKLYMLNQSIIQENEKLRKKAFLLHKENQVLLSQLRNFFSRKQQ